MLRHAAHGVVRYACWDGTTCPGGVGEKGVELAVAAVVEVDVDPAVEGEDEIADGVGALDGVGVAVEGGEKPWVFGLYESAGFGVGPELFLSASFSSFSFLLEPGNANGKRTLYS